MSRRSSSSFLEMPPHLTILMARALDRRREQRKLRWERTYNFSYGSQLRLLQRLNEHPPSLPEQQVREIYDATAKQYPQIFRVYPFEGWVSLSIRDT
jgi:hypothetical protein